MVSQTTKGVKISVETEYQEEYSIPAQSQYVFTYRIRIENTASYAVKLLRRNWVINDAAKPVREVEGEGVVGVQPVIEPGGFYEYVSGCNIQSGIGKMKGTYTMERIMDGKLFIVEIPEFTLLTPFKLN